MSAQGTVLVVGAGAWTPVLLPHLEETLQVRGQPIHPDAPRAVHADVLERRPNRFAGRFARRRPDPTAGEQATHRGTPA